MEAYRSKGTLGSLTVIITEGSSAGDLCYRTGCELDSSHMFILCRRRQGDMGTPQPQVDMGDASGLGSRKRARNGGTSSASRRHIQTEQKRRDKINEGSVSLLLMAACTEISRVPAER